jgi:hypothetical protein
MLRGWSVGKPQPERENLAGLVERVTFHNEDSGFSVLRVKARGRRDLVTVVGHAASISAGEFVHASGRWVNDRRTGCSFAPPPTTSWLSGFRTCEHCLPHFAQYDAFYGDCQSVWAWSAPRSANR